jgi:hypothetical protein
MQKVCIEETHMDLDNLTAGPDPRALMVPWVQKNIPLTEQLMQKRLYSHV